MNEMNEMREIARHQYQKGEIVKAIEFQSKVSASERDPIQRINDLAILSEYLLTHGDYLAALTHAEEALLSANILLDSLTFDYAKVLHTHALCDLKLAKYENGLHNELQAIRIYERLGMIDTLSYIESIVNLGEFYADLGNDKEAVALDRKALELCHKLRVPPLIVAKILNHLSYNLLFDPSGNSIKEACELSSQAIDLFESNNLTMHPYYFESLATRCQILDEAGDILNAMIVGKKSIELYRANGYTHHPDYALALNNCAILYEESSSIKICDMMEEVLRVRKDYLGITHPYYSFALGNLGQVYSNIGQHSKALEMLLQAVSLRHLSIDFEDSYDLTLYSNISNTYRAQSDYNNALKYSLKALGLSKKLYGCYSIDYAECLDDMARVYTETRNYSDALSLFDKSITILDSLQYHHSSRTARVLDGKANCLIETGNQKEAFEVASEAIQILENNNEDGTSLYRSCLESLITSGSSIGVDIANYIYSYDKQLKTTVDNLFLSMLPDERKLFWNMNSRWYTHILPQYFVQSNDTESLDLLYDAALFSKSILLNTDIQIISSLHKDSQANELIESIRLNREVYNSTKSVIPESRIYDLDSLAAQIKILEQELISYNETAKEYLERQSITYSNITDMLNFGEIAIEFYRYTRQNGEAAYLALIADNKRSKPAMVELCTEASLKKLSKNPVSCQEELSALIWKPLSHYLKDKKIIYFSPDGILNAIPLESLPHWSKKGYMSNHYTIFRLSSTKLLNRINKNSSTAPAVLYGGIHYDSSEDVLKKETTRGRISQFSYLPATLDEVNSIQAILEQNNMKAIVITGIDATEDSFKKLSGREISIVHISTHGFNIPITSTDTYWRGFLQGYDTDNPEDIAMEQSGLVFASGNMKSKENAGTVSSSEDGVITAEEISNMDLSSVCLVVLSACHTGEGYISSDGVFGLQRGFKRAGAKSILMTLSEVDDYATTILMTKFYEELQKHLPQVALNRAKEYVRHYSGKVSIDGKEIEVNYSHPKYWAPFIMLD